MAGQQGFTLLELLIAMVLLVVGFLGVFVVFWASAFSGTFTRNMTTAATLGQDMLERVSTVSYNGLGATTGFVDYTSSNISATGFARQWRITENGGVKTITATVSWSDGGRTRTRTFTAVKRTDY
ncbi:hypothetical protein GPICK_05095 [Geobacter pickeringii]|uniref:Pilus assembly protein PilV n=1 Tax=Geobacter pickeringii TaxID=345632 RepID=A0A0B5BI27_9BACT|nr:hypothetical protein GPICK_05095 [Geobacter pickeringii]